jgi:hypothetical protein
MSKRPKPVTDKAALLAAGFEVAPAAYRPAEVGATVARVVARAVRFGSSDPVKRPMP